MTDTENSEEYFISSRNINGYFAFHLFTNLAFWLPIYAIFFLERGLDYTAILLLYAVDTAVQSVLEIPSGALADRWGRRPVLMVGALAQAAGFALIAFGGGIGWYASGMVLHGLALAFLSGADAAFLYDTLVAAGRADEFKQIEGRAYMYQLVAWATGGLLGGWLAAENLSLPFALSALAAFLGFFVIAVTVEPPRHETTASMTSMVGRAARLIRRRKGIRGAIVYASLIFGILLISHKFSQPYLQQAGINLKFFGVVYFGWLMCAALSANYSYRIEAFLGRNLYLWLLPAMTAIPILYMGLFQDPAGAAVILAYQFVWGSMRPQMYQLINQQADGSMRATLLSMIGFGSSLVYIIGAPVFGWLADSNGFPSSLVILGLTAVAIFFPAAYYLVRHHPDRPTEQNGRRIYPIE